MDSKAVVNRRTALGAALVAASPLLLPGRALAQGRAAPTDPFVILLKGLYQPVVHGPNLGLHTVDLSDGSYSTTKIYPIFGTPGDKHRNNAIGDFYVQFTGELCAYDLPGGALAMQFTGSDTVLIPDGQGGNFLQGTFELTILEATRLYRPFAGGHNTMVDTLHLLASGDADEFCACVISRP
jgi:hypothetical protein